MENVTIVGTEDDLLILATGSGERFALAIDDVLQREIRRARRRNADEAPRVNVSPREIQAHIRSGLSAAETAELLGIGVDDVARFEGPVLAEREHIVGQALAVPVLIGSEVEPDAQPTFGAAIRAKLVDLNASAERWARSRASRMFCSASSRCSSSVWASSEAPVSRCSRASLAASSVAMRSLTATA